MVKVKCCAPKSLHATWHKAWAAIPCPYKAFDIACLSHYGHASPHVLPVESALIESHLTAARVKGRKAILRDIDDALVTMTPEQVMAHIQSNDVVHEVVDIDA